MKTSTILSTLGLMGSALAAPSSLAKRSFSCSSPVSGLSGNDCNWLSSIGFYSQGINAGGDPGTGIWIGGGASNAFNFVNSGGNNIILIFWNQPAGSYVSSFMNAVQPQVTYSLSPGASVSVAVQNGISGAFSFVVSGSTTLTQYGQVDNTWGEYTTGSSATFDVSREVEMNGGTISAVVANNGCVSNMNTCVFECTGGATTCTTGYDLINCANGSQNGATYGTYDGAASGGCQGWSNGGTINVSLN